jgi:hypothetical protein
MLVSVIADNQEIENVPRVRRQKLRGELVDTSSDQAKSPMSVTNKGF